MKRTTTTLLLIGLASAMNTVAADDNAISKMLNWHEDKSVICEGHFLTDREVSKECNPQPMDHSRTQITAKGRSSFSPMGTSVLHGDVNIRQPGRLLKADTVRILRDPNTQNISIIELLGQVSLQEHNRTFAADRAKVNIQKNSLDAKNSAFRTEHITPVETLNAWGSASEAYRDGKGNISLDQASYSVCPITNPLWRISASNIYLNKKTGVGTAKNARFLLWGVPVMYFPYLTYPITNERKTGFLIPGFSYDENEGFNVYVPFYANLAPNYDDLFAVHFMTKRGLKLDNTFRYLTAHSLTNFYLSVLPNDTEFREFQTDNKNDYIGMPAFTPFITHLENASDTRVSFSLDHQTTLDQHMGGSANLSWVSDDYYLHDFGRDAISKNTDTLFNQIQWHYNDEHWQLLARAMGYQTLHPIGNINTEPYNRVPQIVTNGFYPNSWLGLDYELWVDYTNFDHRDNFQTDTPVVAGNRLHTLPSIGYNWRRPYAFINPVLRADITNYWLRNQDPGIEHQINRTLPIASIDSGLIFQRMYQCYRQTLEPRIFYLIVPKQNQNDIPLFDTTLPRFNFEQLFFYNRFTGYDRVGDANEITYALSSRFYDNTTGFELFSMSAGMMYQFSKHAVTLIPDGEIDFTGDDKWSPILLNATYHLTLATYAQADLGWSPTNQRTQTGNFRLHYEPLPNHVIHLGYDFVRDGDMVVNVTDKNLSRIDLAFAWPLGPQWSAVADWNYNLSHTHVQHYLAGLSYDSCCWAVRGIISRTALSQNLDTYANFDTKYYLELKFKGLGTVGNSNPSQLLDTSIVGYHDLFRK